MTKKERSYYEQVDRDDMAEAIRGMQKLPRTVPLIERVREVTRSGAARIDGLLVDHFTAAHVVQVYDALNETNKAKFAALPLRRMVDVTWKLVEEVRK